MSFLYSQSVITEPFEKEKWDSSGTYRYDLVLRSYDIFSAVTYLKSENEIIETLGHPVQRYLRKNSPVHLKQGWTTADEVIDLIYCLGTQLNKTSENENRNRCIGSWITLHLYQDSVVDVTIANVD
ncbi:MAG: hypothetical protein COB85_01115 [Bacteroidetes bacterium]|nr:MAG: hypothetical protein COB85_01115 [Bacteroidota bacterium]